MFWAGVCEVTVNVITAVKRWFLVKVTPTSKESPTASSTFSNHSVTRQFFSHLNYTILNNFLTIEKKIFEIKVWFDIDSQSVYFNFFFITHFMLVLMFCKKHMIVLQTYVKVGNLLKSLKSIFDKSFCKNKRYFRCDIDSPCYFTQLCDLFTSLEPQKQSNVINVESQKLKCTEIT